MLSMPAVATLDAVTYLRCFPAFRFRRRRFAPIRQSHTPPMLGFRAICHTTPHCHAARDARYQPPDIFFFFAAASPKS